MLNAQPVGAFSAVMLTAEASPVPTLRKLMTSNSAFGASGSSMMSTMPAEICPTPPGRAGSAVVKKTSGSVPRPRAWVTARVRSR